MIVPTRFEFPELGFMVSQRHWGQGFATEAAKGLIDLAFRDLGLRGLTATSTAENKISLRVLTKLGFARINLSTAPTECASTPNELALFELRHI